MSFDVFVSPARGLLLRARFVLGPAQPARFRHAGGLAQRSFASLAKRFRAGRSFGRVMARETRTGTWIGHGGAVHRFGST